VPDNRTIKRRLSSLYRFIAVLCVLYRLVHSTEHSAEHTVQCSASCTYITVHSTVHIRYSALVQCTVQSTLHTVVQCTVYTSQCTQYRAQCAVQSTLHTVVQCTVYAHHSALSREHTLRCNVHVCWCRWQVSVAVKQLCEEACCCQTVEVTDASVGSTEDDEPSAHWQSRTGARR